MAPSLRFIIAVIVHLCHVCHSTPPEISVLSPADGATVSLPLLVKFRSSRACSTVLAVDGVRVDAFNHVSEAGMTVETVLTELSEETHILSIDIVSSSGELLSYGPRWEILVSKNADSPKDETPDWEVEPFEEYDPNMTPEEYEKTELKDGWLISHEPIEFSRVDPGDTCEMHGWTRRARPRRIYDAFQFFNELDILEIRLHELNETVHKFVLVEATRTHSNQPKPLHYDLNKERFAAFHDKIIHVIVDDLPNHPDAWVLENFQRNTLVRGLSSSHPNDLVVIADVDEIPAGYILDLLRSCDGPSSPTWLYSRFFNFKFEWEFQGQWRHPQILRVAQLKLHPEGKGIEPQRVRFGRMRPAHTKIESAGWHCSFFSDAAGVVAKEWLDEEAIGQAIAEGVDYFNANSKGQRNQEDRHGGLLQGLLPDCYAAHGDDVDLPLLANPTCSFDDHPR